MSKRIRKERTLKIIRNHKMGSDKAWGKIEPEIKQVNSLRFHKTRSFPIPLIASGAIWQKKLWFF